MLAGGRGCGEVLTRLRRAGFRVLDVEAVEPIKRQKQGRFDAESVRLRGTCQEEGGVLGIITTLYPFRIA